MGIKRMVVRRAVHTGANTRGGERVVWACMLSRMDPRNPAGTASPSWHHPGACHAGAGARNTVDMNISGNQTHAMERHPFSLGSRHSVVPLRTTGVVPSTHVPFPGGGAQGTQADPTQ